MNEPILTARDLVAWHHKTSNSWRQLLTDHPDLLAQSCDIAGVATVAELLQHIVAVELRYAERLADLPVSDYANIPFDSVESIYTVHDRSAALFNQQLSSSVDWNESIEFVTRSMGPARSTRRAVFFHAHLHGIRHYAHSQPWLASMVSNPSGQWTIFSCRSKEFESLLIS